jgi:hypothetical protein
MIHQRHSVGVKTISSQVNSQVLHVRYASFAVGSTTYTIQSFKDTSSLCFEYLGVYSGAPGKVCAGPTGTNNHGVAFRTATRADAQNQKEYQAQPLYGNNSPTALPF